MQSEFIAQVETKSGQFRDVGEYKSTLAEAERELESRGLLGWECTQVVEMRPIICSCGREKRNCETFFDPSTTHMDALD